MKGFLGKGKCHWGKAPEIVGMSTGTMQLSDIFFSMSWDSSMFSLLFFQIRVFLIQNPSPNSGAKKKHQHLVLPQTSASVHEIPCITDAP